MNNIADAKQFKSIGTALSATGYQVGFGSEFETEAVAGEFDVFDNVPSQSRR